MEYIHNKFVTIKSMTPNEIKDGGVNLSIDYEFHKSLYGRVLIASTNKGVCFLGFVDQDDNVILEDLQELYPNAKYHKKESKFQHDALTAFVSGNKKPEQITLHISGSEFQLKVWNALLKIPRGEVSTYGRLAKEVESSRASRAVGSAVGANPVAYLIPCHRVILASGEFGDYRWGAWRKRELVNSENEFRLTFQYLSDN